MDDAVNRPAHYNQGPIECIDAMRSAFTPAQLRTFCILNAFKYIWRCTQHKDGVETNVRKAKWFLEQALKLG
jgi:hypothetical protein|eukprot:COSAG01_NODE_4202_length_5244_cov_168.024101_5_plen_72_part_00